MHGNTKHSTVGLSRDLVLGWIIELGREKKRWGGKGRASCTFYMGCRSSGLRDARAMDSKPEIFDLERSPKWARGKPLVWLANDIQENDKLELVWPDQTHRPSVCREARIDTVWLPCAGRKRRLTGGIGNFGEREMSDRLATVSRKRTGNNGRLDWLRLICTDGHNSSHEEKVTCRPRQIELGLEFWATVPIVGAGADGASSEQYWKWVIEHRHGHNSIGKID